MSKEVSEELRAAEGVMRKVSYKINRDQFRDDVIRAHDQLLNTFGRLTGMHGFRIDNHNHVSPIEFVVRFKTLDVLVHLDLASHQILTAVNGATPAPMVVPLEYDPLEKCFRAKEREAPRPDAKPGEVPPWRNTLEVLTEAVCARFEQVFAPREH
jgi:hypothetical protein